MRAVLWINPASKETCTGGGATVNVPEAPAAGVLNGSLAGAVTEGGVLRTDVTFGELPSGSGWSVGGSGFTMTVEGRPATLGPDGAIRVPQGATIAISGTGNAPDSTLAVFAIPRTGARMAAKAALRSVQGAVYLGSVNVDAAGVFSSSVTVPGGLAVGEYVLQINGLSAAGQVRTVDLLMDVISGQQATSGQLRAAAFYQGKSDRLTRAGKAKLRALVSAVPAGAEAVEVSVVGVSVSLPTRSANIALARERAEAIADYLQARGVKGQYVVTISTAYEVRELGAGDRATPGDQPVKSSKGKPLTTAGISYTAMTGLT